jgi:lysophospholipase L1-like esterase
LIAAFQNLPTKPKIFLCRPVPLFRDRGHAWDTDRVLVEQIIPRIDLVAKQAGLPVIDFYAALADHAALLPDGVHPDAAGATILAELVRKAIIAHVAASAASGKAS